MLNLIVAHRRAIRWSIAVMLMTATVASAQPDRVIAFGDSITIGLREPGVDCLDPIRTARGYPFRLEEQLRAAGRDVELLPRGICGETTFEGVTRIDSVLAEGADAIILMEGTNDITSGSPIIGLPAIQFNIRTMANKANNAGVEPMIASIIPYGPGDSRWMMLNQRASRYADNLADLAYLNGWQFTDPFRGLIDVPDVFSRFYDPDGFHLNTAGYARLADVFFEPTNTLLDLTCTPMTPCVPSADTLCLADGRFAVSAEYATLDVAGDGVTIPVTDDTGEFWFFSPNNIELIVKVLDGRCINGHFWVFYGSLTDVDLTLRVVDRETCVRRTFANRNGEFASAGDIFAFAVAPEPGQCSPGG